MCLTPWRTTGWSSTINVLIGSVEGFDIWASLAAGVLMLVK
jgi:hypothetical protein